MKKIITSLRDKIALLLLIILTGGSAFAQQATDTLSESAYNYVPSKKITMYDSPVPYIALGVLFVVIIYVGYRYWHDNRNVNDDIEHTPHHQ